MAESRALPASRLNVVYSGPCTLLYIFCIKVLGFTFKERSRRLTIAQWPERRVRSLPPAVGLQAAVAVAAVVAAAAAEAAAAEAAAAVLLRSVVRPFGRYDAAAMRGDKRACCGGRSGGGGGGGGGKAAAA